ncbi:MAG TPA: hypothetical protein VHD56_20010 [Tepidisphaeraceae bacterium]|nr:hypothetical protein [Tepidisphaeraceae bacterium]
MFGISLAVLLLCGLILARRSVKFWINRLQSRMEDKQMSRRCYCGYLLEGLDMARCPECGRVRNFDATAEELGLTQEELARAQQRQQEREARQ